LYDLSAITPEDAMSINNLTNKQSAASPKKTILTLRNKKSCQEPITMLTGYDYPTALALDLSGIDAILVGDSLGMVVLGYENTLPLTMDEMLHHCRAVARGARSALLIGDMPFMSYQISVNEAVRNAGRFLKEGGMDAVKLEGGRERSETIRAIVGAGIPVMGHLGLTPQSIHAMGGFHPQGRTAKTARQLLADALILEEAGCFGMVLESIPARLAELITGRVSIPTIGIGAGSGTDGQVLVTHDMLGFFDRFTPRFVKKYADLQEELAKAFSGYILDVVNRRFPSQEHAVEMPDDEWQSFIAENDVAQEDEL
jgi:3-methyl-2-oxobutanoate hydroxymethyltransferase